MNAAPLPIIADDLPPPVTPFQRQWRRFRKNKAAVAALWIVGLLIAACFSTVPFTQNQYAATDLVHGRRAPDRNAIFGTDVLGRSVAVRCMLGGVISLTVGFSAALVAMCLGVAWGTTAAMAGGRIDALMMRIVDILFGLPYILLVILLKVGLDGLLHERMGLGSQAANIIVLLAAIGGVSWLTMARVIRGQVLSLQTRPFIEAARALGLPQTRIFLRHILPNLTGPLIVYASLTVPQAILQESFLSFLGIGIQPPMPSWGNLAAEGVTAVNPVQSFWWQLVFPCTLLSLMLLCLNFIGDGLRDALDPAAAD